MSELSQDVLALRALTGLSPRFARTTARAIDRGLLSTLTAASRIPNLAACERVHREADLAAELYLADPAHMHGTPTYPRGPHVVARRHFLPYEHLSCASEYAVHARDPARERYGAYPGNDRAHAYALRHAGSVERPWIFCVHGLGTGQPLMDFPAFRVGQLHHTLGLNVVLPVLPLHGPRRHPKVSRAALASFELLDTFHGLRQAVWDVRRWIAWARAQGATRIGVYGMSVGAYVASLVASLENVEVVIAGIPLVDIPDLIEHHIPLDQARHDTLLSPAVRALFRAISPLEVSPTAPPARRAIYAGSDDLVTTAQQAERLRRHWGSATAHWYPGAHVSFFWARTIAPFVMERLRAASFDAR